MVCDASAHGRSACQSARSHGRKARRSGSGKSHGESAVRAAEETARRQAFDTFLDEITVEQRHYTRQNRLLMQNRKSLVLQERIFFRNLPLSDWIEHEIVLEEGMDVNQLVQDMTVFDKSVVNIADVRSPQKALA
jgi:hypothetical protein